MKCPKCGTYNGKTNKFCRECGLHLSWVVEDDNIQADKANDEVALGEALADVYNCYESGDLDAALAEAEKIVFNNSGSTSAHGVLALIYERKGEMELDAYNAQSARRYLELALSEYEQIISLNPKSTADREKLAVLRAKLKGKKQTPGLWRIATFKKAAHSIPPPLFASGIAFIVILMLAIILIPGSKKSQLPERLKPNSIVRQQASAGSNSSSLESTNSSPRLKVYTFPAPATQSTTPAPTPAPKPATNTKPGSSEVKPVKLPSIGNELTIVAEPKASKKASATVEPAQAKAAKPTPSPQKENTTPKVDGSSLLAAAIQLRNKGQTQEAISTAEQAITHFHSEINSGSNATSAQRGIENAKKLIALWQQAQ
ncbi:zinc ribbon domain-containing protein [bacterium]|nr:zinc ribbon domain-containing protein [bacterium]